MVSEQNKTTVGAILHTIEPKVYDSESALKMVERSFTSLEIELIAYERLAPTKALESLCKLTFSRKFFSLIKIFYVIDVNNV